jgi:hypothetical protein
MRVSEGTVFAAVPLKAAAKLPTSAVLTLAPSAVSCMTLQRKGYPLSECPVVAICSLARRFCL